MLADKPVSGDATTTDDRDDKRDTGKALKVTKATMTITTRTTTATIDYNYDDGQRRQGEMGDGRR